MLDIIGGITLLLIIAVIILVLVKKKNGKGGNLLGRAANLAEGKADRAMENLEKTDPEAVFRAAILETESEVSEMNQLSKEITGLEYQERQKIKNIETKITNINDMITVAVDQDNEEMGIKLYSQLDSLEEEKEDTEKLMKTYEDQAKETLELLNSKVEELEELKVEMKQATNITRSAEIINKVRDRQKGLTNDAVTKGLNSVREKVAESKASLAADKHIKEKSNEGKMEKLRKAGAAKAGKNRFAAMMAAKIKKE